jgi:hypothetical protein
MEYDAGSEVPHAFARWVAAEEPQPLPELVRESLDALLAVAAGGRSAEHPQPGQAPLRPPQLPETTNPPHEQGFPRG